MRNIPFDQAVAHNPSWRESVPVRPARKRFFKALARTPHSPVIPLIMRYAPYSFTERLMNYLRRKLHR